jgi:hypothetical protein
MTLFYLFTLPLLAPSAPALKCPVSYLHPPANPEPPATFRAQIPAESAQERGERAELRVHPLPIGQLPFPRQPVFYGVGNPRHTVGFQAGSSQLDGPEVLRIEVECHLGPAFLELSRHEAGQMNRRARESSKCFVLRGCRNLRGLPGLTDRIYKKREKYLV